MAEHGLATLQGAEQGIIRAVEIASMVMEELAKVGQADQEKTAKLCTSFLDEVKAAHQTLKAAIDSSAPYIPVDRSDYAPKMEAEVGLQKLEVILAQLQAGEN